MWFTDEHKHDLGAIINGENILVNKERAIADDRGISYIIINPEKYNGTEPVLIEIIQK